MRRLLRRPFVLLDSVRTFAEWRSSLYATSDAKVRLEPADSV